MIHINQQKKSSLNKQVSCSSGEGPREISGNLFTHIFCSSVSPSINKSILTLTFGSVLWPLMGTSLFTLVFHGRLWPTIFVFCICLLPPMGRSLLLFITYNSLWPLPVSKHLHTYTLFYSCLWPTTRRSQQQYHLHRSSVQWIPGCACMPWRLQQNKWDGCGNSNLPQ